MSADFTFDSRQRQYENPLTAQAIVVDRSDGTSAASPSTGPQEGQKKVSQMAPPQKKRPGKIPLEKGYSQMDWMRLQNSRSDLSGLNGKALRKDISMDEVRQHSTESDAWTVLRGRVYNITAYMNFHPGGADQLRRGAGKDCTALFMKYHAWVNAEMMLQKCLIGVLAKEPEQ